MRRRSQLGQDESEQRPRGIFGIPISGRTALIVLAAFAAGAIYGYLSAQN